MEYGLVGLALAATLVVGLQLRPSTLLQSSGSLEVSIAGDPSIITCSDPHSGVHVTSLVVRFSGVEVHRTGALGLMGEWKNVTNYPKTIDLVKISSTTALLGSMTLPEGMINLVRLDGVTASANTTTSSNPIPVIVSGGHLDASVSTQVIAGKTTTIVVEPHLVCEGNDNGVLRLTPQLTATSRGPD